MQHSGNIQDFGMDTISLAGTLEAKLQAVREAGFSQIMLSARDLVGHPQGLDAAVAAVKGSGLRVTGFQVLRDFEGLSGHLHDYKIDIAKSMLEMCHALDCRVLLICSSTSVHATGDTAALVKDLRKLAVLAIPMNIKIAYEALSWGRVVNEFPQAWDIISQADMPNLGLGFDSFHMFATKTSLDELDILEPNKIFWCNWPTSCGQRSSRLKSALPRRGISGCSRARACTARIWQRWSTSCTAWVTEATTALKFSMTTTSRCRWPRWPSVPGAQRSGWARMCCADRCRCPTSCGSGLELVG